MEVSHINKSGLLGLETYLMENSRSPSDPFLGEWFMVCAIIPIFYLFTFSLVFLCLLAVTLFSFVLFLFLLFYDQDVL